MKYMAANGAPFGNKHAEAIGKALEQLGDSFTSADVVAAASNPAHPLHEFFTWNDAEAASQHRIEEARDLVASLIVVIRHGEQEPSFVRAFPSVRVIVEPASQKVERRYVSITTVQKTPALAQQVIDQALAEAEAWRVRYKDLDRALGPVFRAIDKVAAKAGKKKKGK